MELKPNMYVRTEQGSIHKVTDIKESRYIYFDNNNRGFRIAQINFIIKASFNIIDLIENKDIIVDKKNRKIEVYEVDYDEKCVYADYDENGEPMHFYEEDIKSIVTKEQFESIKYEVR